MNTEKPHMAVINVSFLIYEIDSTGQPNGQMVGRQAIMKSGVKPKTVSVLGTDYQDCLDKLKAKLDAIV